MFTLLAVGSEKAAMKTRTQLYFLLFTTIYLFSVAFTGISLTGIYTDVVFSVVLVLSNLMVAFGRKTENTWLTRILRSLSVFYAVAVFGLWVLVSINPLITFGDTTCYYYQNIETRLFNVYFEPILFGHGSGFFRITESPKWCPVIEMERLYDSNRSWNFDTTEWNGKPYVDLRETAKKYIRESLIDKDDLLRVTPDSLRRSY